MAAQFLLALDQGTTSSRAAVFTPEGRLTASAAFEFAQRYPRPGWVEHEPEDLVDTTMRAMREAVRRAGVRPGQIAAAGVANQRETTLVWDRETGKALAPAVVWQCRRTAPMVERLKAEGLAPLIRAKTGLVPDAYFSATKLRWLLDEYGLQERAEKGELCFGTVDSFLAFRLLSGQPHVTDATNACRTMLFNLHTQDWDDDLLRAFNLPRALLPRVLDTAQAAGDLHPSLLGGPVPVCALAGDQHAALFGQGCLNPGDVKNTYGTGCFMLMNAGEQPAGDVPGLLSTLAWRIGGKPAFALEGSVFVAGAAIQWLRDELGVLKTAAESEELARQVEDTGGVHFVPAFTGLGAPHWNMYARGTLLGLTRGSNRCHLARAALESIAFQSDDLLRLMAGALGRNPGVLRADGGGSANSLMMQLQADISGVRVQRPQERETTALGAALLAGVGKGLIDGPREAAALWRPERDFEPTIGEAERKARRAGWAAAVETALTDAGRREGAACS